MTSFRRTVLLVTVGALWATGAMAQQTPVYPMEATGHGPNGDWPFLSRYRDDNAHLGKDTHRVIFFGDSISEFWAAEPSLRDRPHFVGRGIGGQTTMQMIVRFRSDVIDLHPAVVQIMAGTNDVAGNNGPESDQDIEDALQSMVDLAKQNGIKVVLAWIPPADAFDWRPGSHPTARIQRPNAWIKAFAKSSGEGYVDYWPVLATPTGALKKDLTADGVHPNALGYKAMAPLAEAAVRSAEKVSAR